MPPARLLLDRTSSGRGQLILALGGARADTSVMTPFVDEHQDEDRRAVVLLIGGLRAGGMNATWPLISVFIEEAGAVIAPRRWWFGWFVPTYQFPWSSVRKIAVTVGLFGSRHGVRFILTERPRVSGGQGTVMLWRRLVGRPIVRLFPHALDRALDAIPENIPRTECRGFIFWP